MRKPHMAHEDATIENLRKDPAYAAEYRNAVLEDGSLEDLLLVLWRIAKPSA